MAREKRTTIGILLSNGGHVVMRRACDEGLAVIGRNPECDICIPDAEVAPVQALLRRDGDTLTLINRDPEGTPVGAGLVTGELRLGDGDIIRLGRVVATVCFEREPEVASSGGQTRTLTTTGAQTLRAWLAVPEAQAGERFSLDAVGLDVGTDPANGIVLKDPYVSAFHARVMFVDGRVIVRDLGSRNGVFVGERKVREGEVPPGVQLRLGRTVLMVHTESEGTDARPRVSDKTKPLIGSGRPMAELRDRIRRVAACNAPVLITGDTGTGKEVVARLVASLSARAAQPFLAINCGALGKSLIESELFGHEKGAFTGAVVRKVGAFEAANGGTLFLDEIGELPLALQPQLLRVLETGEVRLVGGVENLKVDVRLVAATNRHLEQEVAMGAFREDLYHRLHVLTLELPTLRERREDIPELSHYFIEEFTPPGEQVILSDDAIAKLVAHEWPGNVRELRNTLQRAVLMRQTNVLGADDIVFTPSTLQSRVETESVSRQRTLCELEREAIVAELARHYGSKTETAAALGLSRSTIHRKVEEYGIDVEAIQRQCRGALSSRR